MYILHARTAMNRIAYAWKDKKDTLTHKHQKKGRHFSFCVCLFSLILTWRHWRAVKSAEIVAISLPFEMNNQTMQVQTHIQHILENKCFGFILEINICWLSTIKRLTWEFHDWFQSKCLFVRLILLWHFFFFFPFIARLFSLLNFLEDFFWF